MRFLRIQTPRHSIGCLLPGYLCCNGRRMTSSTATTTVVTASLDNNVFQKNRRTSTEIRQLVQERVKERNQFHVHGKRVIDMAHPSRGAFWKFFYQMIQFRPVSQDILDRELPVRDLVWEDVVLNNNNINNDPKKNSLQATWLGHASVLLQFANNGTGDGDSEINILCDPVFSDRCSAVQWMGPKRIRRVPLGDDGIARLCQHIPIELVLISHNHYDHLDYNTVRELHRLVNPHFVVPLGLGAWFRNHIDEHANITELDWHESTTFTSTKQTTTTITAVPMRHWSNRFGHDRDQTLWCGYSIESAGKKFFFAGDTAYFDELKTLGEQYGPWDAGALPIGAYSPRDVMESNHMNVPEAIRCKDLLQISNVLPIHWGTFPLTVEPTLEPRDWLLELMKDRLDADSFVPWFIGESKMF